MFQIQLISNAIDFQKDNNSNNDLIVSTSADWHHTISQDVRNHLIDKQAGAIRSVHQDIGESAAINALIAICGLKLSEETFFRMAKSKIEYYQCMADAIYYKREKLKSDQDQVEVVDLTCDSRWNSR